MAPYLTVVALFATVVSAATTVYHNHTVGGTAGWFFNATTNTPATNYSSWAANQTFNLGDYLSKLNHTLSLLIILLHFEEREVVVIPLFGCREKKKEMENHYEIES